MSLTASLKQIRTKWDFIISDYRGEYGLLLLILFCFAFLYSTILTFRYTGADFFAQIAGNTNLNEALTTPLSKEFLGDSWYRPVDTITLTLNYQLGGLHPFIYQATNLIIFLATVLIVYFFVKTIFQSKKLAFLSSIIFGLYPLNMYVVPTVTQRAEMLIALFFMITIITLHQFLKTENKIWYILSVCSAFLVVTSKEIGFIMMPVLVFIYIVINQKHESSSIRNIIRLMIPFFMTILVYFSLIALFLGEYSARGLQTGSQGLINLLTDRFIALSIFLKSIVYPVDPFDLDFTYVTLFSGAQIPWGYVIAIIVGFLLFIWFVYYLFQKKISIKSLFSLSFINKQFHHYDFLILWILIYVLFFISYGRYAIYYSYFLIAPLSILIALVLLKKKSRIIDKISKLGVLFFVIFSIALSPVFTSYQNYEESSAVKKAFVPEVISSFQQIPQDATIYVIPAFGGSKGPGYSTGIPPYSLHALLTLSYPNNNWTFYQINQVVIDDAQKPFSSRYMITENQDNLTIDLSATNMLFYQYPEQSHTLPVRENVSLSGGFFPMDGKTTQRVTITNRSLATYMLLTSIENNTVHIDLTPVFHS